MPAVSFQGERGAYSEAAAARHFGGCETLPLGTLADALAAAEDGRADCAVLPAENLLEGSVGETYDLLRHTGLAVSGEIYHRIEHCLLGTGALAGVSTVYSHPQALGQCRRFVEGRGMRAIPAHDTAGSARMVVGMGRDDCAAIASEEASSIYGLPVISRGIADDPDNYTRFLVLSRAAAPRTGADKTSVILSLRHEPGSLQGILAALGGEGVNLTKIESRPARTGPWAVQRRLPAFS